MKRGGNAALLYAYRIIWTDTDNWSANNTNFSFKKSYETEKRLKLKLNLHEGFNKYCTQKAPWLFTAAEALRIEIYAMVQ